MLFKDILGAISLILRYRTTCWLDLEYSLTFTMWEAISIFISIISNGLIPGGQNLSRRQSVFFLPVDPRKDHKDPEYIDYSAPRLAWYLQNTWKRHQDTVFLVDIDLGIRRINVLSDKIERNYSSRNTSSPLYCEKLKDWEMERNCMKNNTCPRPPPKISLKHDLNWSKGKHQGSTVEHRPVGKLVQQSLGETLQSGSSKPTPIP